MNFDKKMRHKIGKTGTKTEPNNNGYFFGRHDMLAVGREDSLLFGTSHFCKSNGKETPRA